MPDYLRPEKLIDSASMATVFDELSFWAARFGILLFDQLEILPDLHILDLGCGTGFPLFELAHLHGPSTQVTGLDVWAEGIARARFKAQLHGLPNLPIVEADAVRMPFPDDAFDLIVSNLGINNFADPAAVFAECFRVAKPGSRLVLTTNVQGHYEEFYQVYRETLSELKLDHHLERLARNEAHRGTGAGITALIEGCGFPVTRTVEDRFRMRFLDGSALLRHPLTRIGFLDGWRSVVEPAEEEEVFSVLELKLNRLARHNGGLTLSVPMLYLEARRPRRPV